MKWHVNDEYWSSIRKKIRESPAVEGMYYKAEIACADMSEKYVVKFKFVHSRIIFDIVIPLA
jgi:hypothetical protein